MRCSGVREKSVRYLGIALDHTLQWSDHIESVLTKIIIKYELILIIKDEVSLNVLITAYYGLFYSNMSYGILLWGGSSNAIIIFKLQKRALRTIFGKKSRDSCKLLFRENNILTMISLFIFKNLMLIKEKEQLIARADKHIYK
ncbi:hypothetical protein O3M35_006627 [Rhynocoris fuscipes]|uniref:Uncharacterized protein n=1 Tax=Rhynocoris fuscipes TaxID=488301 RepID=A0AAW1DEF3_9HEMI